MVFSASVGFVFGVARRYFIRIRAISVSHVLHSISNRKHEPVRAPLSHVFQLVTNQRGTDDDIRIHDNRITTRHRRGGSKAACKQSADPRDPSPLHERNAVR